MILKKPAILALPLLLALFPVTLFAQAASPTTSSAPAASPTAAASTPAAESQPHITIATPAPAPAPWPLQERISWAASLILVVFAYVGIMLAISALRKIERHLHANEVAIQNAADATKGALEYMQAQVQAERPWILVSPEPTHGVPGSFDVVATNRGKTPARITSLSDGVAFVKEESQLSSAAIYKSGEPRTPLAAMILLPGETAVVKNFRRDDVASICESPEHLERVENWEERIYLMGTITYVDLRPSEEKQARETTWCCWYIHGRQKSGLVLAGASEFNRHT